MESDEDINWLTNIYSWYLLIVINSFVVYSMSGNQFFFKNDPMFGQNLYNQNPGLTLPPPVAADPGALNTF